MEFENEQPPCHRQTHKTSKVAEPAGAIPDVIPFVSPETAAEVFSSMPVISLEDAWAQVDRSLGRLPSSE